MWLFDKGHAAYWLLASLAIVVTMACVLVPALAALFRFAAPAPYDALIATAAGAGAVVLLDFAKLFPGMQRILGGATASARRPETYARETALRI
jgi:hypothetical protein